MWLLAEPIPQAPSLAHQHHLTLTGTGIAISAHLPGQALLLTGTGHGSIRAQSRAGPRSPAHSRAFPGQAMRGLECLQGQAMGRSGRLRVKTVPAACCKLFVYNQLRQSAPHPRQPDGSSPGQAMQPLAIMAIVAGALHLAAHWAMRRRWPLANCRALGPTVLFCEAHPALRTGLCKLPGPCP